MSTIKWANSASGTFSTASDWVGGAVPGSSDTAVIDASSGSRYTITVASATSVGALVLDWDSAALSIESDFTAPSISLEAGTLLMTGGTLSGNVVAAGPTTKQVESNSTFKNVSWAGNLNVSFAKAKHHQAPPVLTFDNSLTLTGANGTGSGSGTFGGDIAFNGLTTLDNASIIVSGKSFAQIEGAPSTTFGSQLNYNGGLVLSAGDTLVNDGKITTNSLSGGTLVNTGLLTLGSAEISPSSTSIVNNGTFVVASGTAPAVSGAFLNDGLVTGGFSAIGAFTNNGTISVGAGSTLLVRYGELTAAGANAAINIHSGTLSVDGTLTTAQLLAVPASQHVSFSGSFGTDLGGSLNNAGATLDFGKGTAIGNLNTYNAAYDGDTLSANITGGTLVNQGANTPLLNFRLSNLTFVSTVGTLSVVSFGMNDVDMSGVTTLNFLGPFYGDSPTLTGGTLSGLGTLNVSGGINTLDGVDITGIGNSGHVTVNMSPTGELAVSDAQSLAGYTINVTNASSSTQRSILATYGTDSAALTLSTTTAVNVATGAQLAIGSDNGAAIDNMGDITSAGLLSVSPLDTSTSFTNTGTIDITAGGTLYLDPTSSFVNNGTITLNQGTLELNPSSLVNNGSLVFNSGTLALDGSLTVASLSAVSHHGGAEIVNGILDLGGATISPGQGGVPAFSLGHSGIIQDGTLKVIAGGTFVAIGGGTIYAAVNNQGALNFSGAYTTDGIDGALSGQGTTSLLGTGTRLELSSSAGAQQTIDFGGPTEILNLAGAATSSFAATIGGFAVGDGITFNFSNGASLTAASFKGSSIAATLSNGTTLTLKTTSALTGSITVSSSFADSILTYASNTASVQDWSAAVLYSTHIAATDQLRDTSGAPVSHDYIPSADLLLHWHG